MLRKRWDVKIIFPTYFNCMFVGCEQKLNNYARKWNYRNAIYIYNKKRKKMKYDDRKK